MKAVPYADLHTLSEDDRITLAGKAVMNDRLTIGVLTDDEPGKPERYIAKLKERFPGIVIVGQWKGPVKGCVTIKVGPPPISPSVN